MERVNTPFPIETRTRIIPRAFFSTISVRSGKFSGLALMRKEDKYEDFFSYFYRMIFRKISYLLFWFCFVVCFF